MKNLIVNIFKTLFFFDAAVIVLSLLPVIQNSNPALAKLISEALVLAVTVIFTFVFLRFVEKNKLKFPYGKKKVKLFFTGFGAGAVIPIAYIAILAATKDLNFIGFNKIDHAYYWILALLCNAISSELLFRGYLFLLYKKYYGFTFAAFVTTLLFLSMNLKLFSMDTKYIINIILFNILLCFLLEFSNSVVVTITARFVYTLLSTFVIGSLPLTEGFPVLLNRTFSENKYMVGEPFPIESSTLITLLIIFITVLFIIKKYHPVRQLKKLNQYIKSRRGKKQYKQNVRSHRKIRS